MKNLKSRLILFCCILFYFLPSSSESQSTEGVSKTQPGNTNFNTTQNPLLEINIEFLSEQDLQITDADLKPLDSASANKFRTGNFIPRNQEDTLRLMKLYTEFSAYYMKFAQLLSLKLSKNVLHMALLTGNREFEASAYATIGTILSWHGTNELTIKYTKRSLEISDSIGKKNFSFFRHLDLASWLKKDSLSAAIEMQKAWQIANEYEDEELLGYYYQNIAGRFLGKKNFQKAFEYFNRSAEIFIKRNEPDQYGKSYRYIADMYCGLGKFDLAMEYYNKTISAMDTSNRGNALSMYKRLGNLELKRGNYRKAEQLFKRGLEINALNPSIPQTIEYLECLSKAYAGEKNYAAAYQTNLQFYSMRDSVDRKEKEIQSEMLKAEYGAGVRNQQILLLTKENEIQQAETERQQLIRNYILVISALALGFSLLIFNRFKLKKRIEKQQAIIDERQRISRELHDDLGAQLSTAKMFLHSIKDKQEISTSNFALENSLGLIDSTINDLRGIMDDLKTNILHDKGYISATEELVNRINQLQQINFTLTHFNAEKRWDRKTEHHLFRITQELINNSLKYARAKNVSINLLRRESKIIFMYEDDGTGFKVEEINKGNGLLNIESRCKSVGGIVEFDTEPGRGFRCNIELAMA